MKKVLICLTILSLTSVYAADDCRVNALEEARKASLKMFIEESGSDQDEISYELVPFRGIEFGDCCWANRTLNIKKKDSPENILAKYDISAGNSYGEYQRGNCVFNISNQKNYIQLQTLSYCEESANKLAKLLISSLANVEAQKFTNNDLFSFNIFEEGKKMGTLSLSPVNCNFVGFEK